MQLRSKKKKNNFENKGKIILMQLREENNKKTKGN